MTRCARAVTIALAIWGLAGMAGPAKVSADARTDYLVRVLATSGTFRVRAQAALSLARVDPTPDVVDALAGALSDEHASVRAAAASSLERLGDPRALPALEAAANDADRDVRHAIARATQKLARAAAAQRDRDRAAEPTARFYVGVGLPGSRAEGVDDAMLRDVREFIRRRVARIDGVELAPDDQAPGAVDAVLRERRLVGFFLDASIVRVDEIEDGTRAVVSLLVNTYPGRNMRAMLQGAATVQGASRGAVSRRQAIEGALSGALRRVPEAFEESASRGGG